MASENASSVAAAAPTAASCARNLPPRGSSSTTSAPGGAGALPASRRPVAAAVDGHDQLEPVTRPVERQRVRDLLGDHGLLAVRGDDQRHPRAHAVGRCRAERRSPELISKAELSAAEIIAHEAIRRQAVTDPLTGLGNRRKLSADLAAALRDPCPSRPSLLLLFDLDGFKDYNDTFGHLAGDALLARLGRKLDETVAGVGSAYRLGGDEFCAHVQLDGQDADALILRASAALTESGTELSIEASLGVVLLPHEADSADHALQVADERMYADKRTRSTARSQAGEVLLRTMHAKQPELDEHSSNVAELATRGRAPIESGRRGSGRDRPCRRAARHRQGRHPRRDPQQVLRPHRGRVGVHLPAHHPR